MPAEPGAVRLLVAGDTIAEHHRVANGDTTIKIRLG
jgi:hypothetical protein